MMGRDRYNTGQADDLRFIIADLKRRVDDLERGGRIGNTAIDKGDLEVRSGSSIKVFHPDLTYDPIVRIGNMEFLNEWGINVKRPDGVQLFDVGASALGGDFDGGLFEVNDAQGNVVISTYAGEFGMSRPYLQHRCVPTANYSVPSQSTTSGSFTPLWTVWGYTFHLSIQFDFLIYNDAGTTSEARLRDASNGAILATSGTFAAGSTNQAILYGDHVSSITPGTPFAGMTFKTELDVRRISGAGVVRVEVNNVMGF